MKKRREGKPGSPGFGPAARLAVALAGAVMLAGGSCEVRPASEEAPAEAPAGRAHPRPTRLTLVCVDEEGRPVIPSSAKLLVSAWGSMEQLELKIDGSTVELRLDVPWLQEAYPFSKSQPLQRGHVLLKADGLVTLRSDAIFWLGVKDGGSDRERETTEVSFPSQRPVELREGMEKELRVVFRRPRPRYLKILDLEGNPVPGVEVTSEIFWTHENHCCFPVAVEPLGRSVTDSEGRVPLVDGDFEYGFEIEKPHWSLVDSGSCYPSRVETVLESEETVLWMRHHEPQRLEMIVTENGSPVVDRQLFGELAPWRCGAIDGPFDVTDAEGRVTRSEFYPEELGALWFEDEQGKRIWSASPAEWTYPARIRVELGEDRV